MTNLRELSFAYGISNNGITDFTDTPTTFLKNCKKKITSCERLKVSHISKNKEFNQNELSAIQNGLNLAKYILDKNIIKEPINLPIQWIGEQTQSGNPYDIIINDIPFSLKEESFILENMGLYKLLNTVLDTNTFKRGIHIFEKYAKTELNEWFETTKKLLMGNLLESSFNIEIPSKITKLSYSRTGDNLYFFYKGEELHLKGFSEYSYDDFMKKTTSVYREKVFSKCINERLSYNETYNESKKKCAIEAGKNFVSFVEEKRNTDIPNESLYNLFRIKDEEYYYAKITNKAIEVYKIPKKSDFNAKIEIKDIKYSVPKSQLNILTTVQNIDTKEEFIFRNELRYSHGQFNGTPEAKLYTDTGSLEIAYEKV